MIAATVVAALATTFVAVPAIWPDPCRPAGGYSSPRNGVLKFGAIFPQSGTLASQGPQLFAATDLALQDVARAGGVPGMELDPFTPAVQRDEGEPGSGTACESAANLLTAGVDVIMGPAASGNSLAIIDQVTQADRVLVSPASTSPELSGAADLGRSFRTVPSDVLQGRVLGDLVATEGGSRVAVIARDDAYGRGLQEQVVRELAGKGLTDVRSLTYHPEDNRDTIDFSPALAGLRSQNPNAVVLIGFDEVAPLLQQMIAEGYGPSARKLYGTDGFLRKSFPGQVVAGEPGMIAGLRGTTPLLAPELQTRLDAFRPGLQDFTYTSQAYDAVIVTALAAAAAGTDDPEVFARGMNDVTREGQKCDSYAACIEILRQDRTTDIDYDGESGPLEFTSSGEPCQGIYSVVKYDDQGNLGEYRRGTGTNLCTGLWP